MEQINPRTIELFVLFSRFESAMKRGGFLRGEAGERAIADWVAFGGALGEDFFPRHEACPAVHEIFREGPRKAVVRIVDHNGVPKRKLDWGFVESPRSGAELVDAVRRIRNNLFHGDKWNPDHVRNGLLIDAALVVLSDAEEIAKAKPELIEFTQHMNYPPPKD